MGWLFHKEVVGEYWYYDCLFGALWAGGYDAITICEVFGLNVYKRVGCAYRIFGVSFGGN